MKLTFEIDENDGTVGLDPGGILALSELEQDVRNKAIGEVNRFSLSLLGKTDGFLAEWAERVYFHSYVTDYAEKAGFDLDNDTAHFISDLLYTFTNEHSDDEDEEYEDEEDPREDTYTEEPDTSDIPEADEAFFDRAEIRQPVQFVHSGRDWESMTLEELRAEEAHWANEISESTEWGAGLAAAISFQKTARTWIDRREKEQDEELDITDVMGLTGYKDGTIYGKIKTHGFPAPHKSEETGNNAWNRSDIISWMEDYATADVGDDAQWMVKQAQEHIARRLKEAQDWVDKKGDWTDREPNEETQKAMAEEPTDFFGSVGELFDDLNSNLHDRSKQELTDKQQQVLNTVVSRTPSSISFDFRDTARELTILGLIKHINKRYEPTQLGYIVHDLYNKENS